MSDFFRKCYRIARRNPLPLWAGFSVIGAIQIHRIYQRNSENNGNLSEKHNLYRSFICFFADTFSVSLYKNLPLRSLSRLWGQLHDLDLPEWSRPFLLGSYVKIFKCNLEEAQIQVSLSQTQLIYLLIQVYGM